MPRGQMAENKDQFPIWVFSSLWHNQNGSCMQKYGQGTLKIGYLINFSWMRLQIPSLTCGIHRSKARAVLTSALSCRCRSCCGQCVAVCALTELRFAGQVLKPEPGHLGVPKALSGALLTPPGTQPHLQPLNHHFPHLKTGIKIPLLVFSVFQLFHDPGMLSPPLQSAQLSETSNPPGTSSPPKTQTQGLMKCSMSRS